MLLHWIRGNCAGTISWQPDSHSYTDPDAYRDCHLNSNTSDPVTHAIEYIHCHSYTINYAVGQRDVTRYIHSITYLNIHTGTFAHPNVDSHLHAHAFLHGGCGHIYTFIYALPIAY